MDQVIDPKEARDKVRAAKIVRYMDYVEPKIGAGIAEFLLNRPSEKKLQEDRLEREDQYWELVQLHARCFIDSWNYYSPDGEWGAAEKQTVEEAEQGKDNLLEALLTYEKRAPLGISELWAEANWVWQDIRNMNTGVLKDHFAAARKYYPEAFERKAAREKH